MIRVEKNNILPDGSVAVYSRYIPEIGSTIPVKWGDEEGTALVVKTTLILRGQLFLVILDVDWSSFL